MAAVLDCLSHNGDVPRTPSMENIRARLSAGLLEEDDRHEWRRCCGPRKSLPWHRLMASGALGSSALGLTAAPSSMQGNVSISHSQGSSRVRMSQASEYGAVVRLGGQAALRCRVALLLQTRHPPHHSPQPSPHPAGNVCFRRCGAWPCNIQPDSPIFKKTFPPPPSSLPIPPWQSLSMAKNVGI